MGICIRFSQGKSSMEEPAKNFDTEFASLKQKRFMSQDKSVEGG